VKDGNKEAIFSCAYALGPWNLACQGDSTGLVCINHFLWDLGSLGIPFAHKKEAQLGNDPWKKRPWSIFSNPTNYVMDCILALF